MSLFDLYSPFTLATSPGPKPGSRGGPALPTDSAASVEDHFLLRILKSQLTW